jgi:hypothetical protein
MNLQKLFGTSLESIQKAIVTFWYPILCGTIIALWWIKNICFRDLSGSGNTEFFWTVAITYGFPLGFTIHLLKKKIRPGVEWGLYALATGIIIGVGFWIQEAPDATKPFIILLLALIGHLLVSISSFWHKDEENLLWQYNVNLLIEFLKASCFTAVLYIGLAIALAALQFLLGVKIDQVLYYSIFLFMAFVVQPILFFNGYLNTQNELGEFPKFLKHLIKYVLLPLVAIYVLILYAFGLKIIFGESPKGFVSWLVLSLSVLGILVLLLSYPLRKAKEEYLIGLLDKYYFWVMIPLLFILGWAIRVRVEAYGLTENRVAIVYLFVWLVFITVYMLTGRRLGLIMVPLSLTLFTTSALVGPLSLIDLSVNDQAKKLVLLLQQHKWNGSKLNMLNKKEQKKITKILHYLIDRKALQSINDAQTSLFPKMVALKTKNDSLLIGQLGLYDSYHGNDIYAQYETTSGTLNVDQNSLAKPQKAVGAIKLIEFQVYNNDTTAFLKPLEFKIKDGRYLVIKDASVPLATILEVDLFDIFFKNSTANWDDVPSQKMTIPLRNQKGEILINLLRGEKSKKETIRIIDIEFIYMEYAENANSVP